MNRAGRTGNSFPPRAASHPGVAVDERAFLVRRVWPDKAMYAALMLLVAGLVGVYYAAVSTALEVEVSPDVPRALREADPAVAVTLSLVASFCAVTALAARRIGWAYLGAGAGLASGGALGVEGLLALVGLGFAVLSTGEREDATGRALRASMWPDKSLAASMLLLVTAVLSAAWGAALLSGLIEVRAALLGNATAAGLLGLAAAAVCGEAARRLYRQRGLGLGVAGGVAGIVGMGFGFLAPLLSVAALGLLHYARREKEFEAPASAEKGLTRA